MVVSGIARCCSIHDEVDLGAPARARHRLTKLQRPRKEREPTDVGTRDVFAFGLELVAMFVYQACHVGFGRVRLTP